MFLSENHATLACFDTSFKTPRGFHFIDSLCSRTSFQLPATPQLSLFILKLLPLMKYFRRYQPPNSPLARFFFAMDIKLCSIHGLARKALNAFAILDPIYNNFPIENPECAHKDFREALRDLKISLSLACYAKHQTEASQEACTLNNDYGMKFSADYVCFTRWLWIFDVLILRGEREATRAHRNELKWIPNSYLIISESCLI